MVKDLKPNHIIGKYEHEKSCCIQNIEPIAVYFKLPYFIIYKLERKTYKNMGETDSLNTAYTITKTHID